MLSRQILLAAFLSSIAVVSAAAQRPTAAPTRDTAAGARRSTRDSSASESRGGDSTGVPALERVSTTKHSVTINGRSFPTPRARAR
jgi:hypothetical protein